ncbi:MAG TPA: ABC transporter ATP-binding protein [Caldisericia bacterium]|nr:ABC transporter ATP-binding protein [Caldisericia bacterium]HPF49498.1 ABC transporter ATP-binding protein [Caldisericia bacterium]HPI84208.1 ABC transporter ATP-binding protein [Caldisericia bacterium]HPQ93497.1 ABC transporter ATP-binding protein [Caldisericia bacterium]HRV75497.1 ABC transporter ATP-binding protein [Caldisericia bacterium]
MNDTAMRVNSLVKTYTRGSETIRAVDGVSLDIDSGEMLAIMGRSGAGKTSLLSCIGLLEGFDSGKLSVLGHDMSDLTEAKRTINRRSMLGFVFQRFFLLPTLTAYENVSLPFLFSGKRANKERVLSLLETVGLSERIYHKPSQMSGGEMQRVAIARALALDPPIIIADEPTGNLDSKNADKMFALFEDLANKGKTIIIATHSKSLADRCHRVVELSDGRKVRDEKN